MCEPDVILDGNGFEIWLTVSNAHGTMYDHGSGVLKGDWIHVRKTMMDRTWILEITHAKECAELLRLIHDRAKELGWELS